MNVSGKCGHDLTFIILNIIIQQKSNASPNQKWPKKRTFTSEVMMIPTLAPQAGTGNNVTESPKQLYSKQLSWVGSVTQQTYVSKPLV